MSMGSKNHWLQYKMTKYLSYKVPKLLRRAFNFIRYHFITLVLCHFGTLSLFCVAASSAQSLSLNPEY